MEDVEAPQEPTINFVPTLCFVPRGIAKERPDKIVMTPAELDRVLQQAENRLENIDRESDDDSNDENMDVDAGANPNDNSNDEFNFDNYDNEQNVNPAHIGSVTNEQLEDEEDSEAEDDIIKPTDNLLLVGHVQDDAASLEVWIFNEIEQSLYTHHDFLLGSFPLCIEWLNHDAGSDKPGNLCAIGSMDPVITIWDLDIQESLEPTFKLGSKGSRTKNKPRVGHKDAVLDLSWNRQYEHILASASVDQTVLLWDLDEGTPHTTITSFKEKVQSIEFHPEEMQTLLTGCSDRLVRLFDCRQPDEINNNFTKWKITGEVEKVLWHPTELNNFIIGSNDGSLYYADKRQPKNFLWSLKAHSEEISGVCFNAQMPNLLTSTSTDGALKIWNINANEIKAVYSHDFDMGRLQCMKQCPEDPYTLAFGGEKTPHCRVYNIKNFEAVRRTFEISDAE